MPPHNGLSHLKEYDIKDSNVELIGTDIDHKVKYNSALTEPAWNNGYVGQVACLCIWRMEDFEVIPWPKERIGEFYSGDSYIILNSYKIGEKHGNLHHDIFFWLGAHTTADEAGTAAYKSVELDEFLHGKAVQHRELQGSMSAQFSELFPRIRILSGGVKSGFTHVEKEVPKEVTTLLRVCKPAGGKSDGVIVHEVEPTWSSLDEDDVFILDKGNKIWVWQGKKCSPMEKAKAAQVVNDMTLAKHIDVEVLAQTDARSRLVVTMLGGEGVETKEFKAQLPAASRSTGANSATSRPRRLFRLSDASGQLSFDLIKEGEPMSPSDLDSNDVFLIDTESAIWVWRGEGASQAEKSMWLKVAQTFVNRLEDNPDAYLLPIASVVEGGESQAFRRALEE